MVVKRTVFVAFLLIFSLLATAQKKVSKEIKKDISILGPAADYLFAEQNYYRALALYKKILKFDSTRDYYLFQAGICCLYTDDKEKSLNYFKKVYVDDPQMNDILFYLGRAYHINYEFDSAINYFQQYLALQLPDDKKRMAKNYIEYCNNAKDLIDHKDKLKVMNVGPTINTAASEYAPVITTDESEIIYTYRGPMSTGGLMNIKFQPDSNGEYYEDIFMSQKEKKSWTDPIKIPGFDTKGNNASIALSNDGHTLFTFESTAKDGGDIYMSTLQDTAWSKPESLGSNINTQYWEGSCSLSSDGRTLYFASERPGGFGGRDIYFSRKQKDGKWGAAQNLGGNINTPLNEDAPFIHPDGVTLFFSSEGWSSMGGYDIFYSTLNLVDSTWNRPINMGYPINSPDDDRYYVLSADGSRGYFSSNRKGGYGEEDIYIVNPGYKGSRPVLALTIGVVTKDEEPVKADINVTDTKTQEDRGTYYSNPKTGKYIIALTPGTRYKIAVEVQGMEPHIEYLDIDSLATFVRVQEDIHLYTDEYKQKHKMALADTASTILQQKVEQQVAAYKAEGNLNSTDASVYQKILDNYGTVDSTGISYNVELGTYQNAKDFDSTKYRGMGKILSRTDNYGNTTFYIDSVHTLLDAEILKYKVISHDSSMRSHTLVTVNDHEKRKLMQQFYASEYAKDQSNFIPDTTVNIIKSKQIISLNTEEKPKVGVPMDTTKIARDFGRTVINGVSYRLELGSYTDTSQFNMEKFSKYGPISREKFADGTTHYYMGPFHTLADAQNFKRNLVEKDAEAAKSVIMVFYLGKPKTVEDFFNPPCNPGPPLDFSSLVGKDLNDTAVYNQLLRMAGDICKDGLTFRVQIAAYRHPKNYSYKHLLSLMPPDPVVITYADGITRFTLGDFRTLTKAEIFRQIVKGKGQKDAWITAVYNGKRMLLQELIAVNFYSHLIN